MHKPSLVRRFPFEKCHVLRSFEGRSIEIKDCSLEQESFTIALVEDSIDVAQDVSHQCSSNGSCNVRTPVSSALCGEDRPNHLVIAGSVVVTEGARRYLRALNSQNRQILKFDTTVLLKNVSAKQSDGDNDAGPRRSKFLWLLLLLVLLVIFLIYWRFFARRG
jgi:hypothetical protein